MKVKNLSILTGLDFGTDSLKVVVIRKGKTGLTLTGYANISYGGAPLEDPVIVAGFIKKALSTVGSYARQVFVTLSTAAPLPLIRYQMLNNIPVEEMRAALKVNSATYLNQDYSDFYLDCAPLPVKEGQDPKASKISFLIAGAPKKDVDVIYKGLRAARLQPLLLEVSGISLINAYEYVKNNYFKSAAVMLVDIGHSISSISITNRGIPELTRLLDFGGRKINETIASELSIAPVAAQQQKLHPSEQVDAIIRQSTVELTREIKASMQFFEGQTGTEVGKVHLSGGTGRSEAVRTAITEDVGVACELWNPFESMALNLKLKAANRYAKLLKTVMLRPVWRKVRASNSSSIVPNPPGNATRAFARSRKWNFRIAK